MPITIQQIGERVDLQVRQGSTLGPIQSQLTDKATSLPIDLTNKTVRGMVRRAYSDKTPAAVMVVSMPTPTSGAFSFHIEAEDTAKMEVGATSKDPGSIYVWDMEMEDAATGFVTPLYFGVFTLYPEVTKPDVA